MAEANPITTAPVAEGAEQAATATENVPNLVLDDATGEMVSKK
jgi:hypothetical protein